MWKVQSIKSALINYDINIQLSIVSTETGSPWWCISKYFCLVSVLRSLFPLGLENAPLPPSGKLAGRRSSDSEGDFHVLEPYLKAEMFLKGRGNEPAIRLETQSF